MYDLINIIEIKLSGIEQLINKWMMNNQLIKSSILSDIQSIQININKYHNKYVICKYWNRYGKCKYGSHCWYLHPTNSKNNKKEKFVDYGKNNNNNQKTKETKKENSQKKNQNFQEFSYENNSINNGYENSNNEYYTSDSTYNNNKQYYDESEYYDSVIGTESDESDDSDFDADNHNTYDNDTNLKGNNNNNRWDNYNNNNGKKHDSQCGFRVVKKKKNKKKKKKKKTKKWKRKKVVNNDITQTKNFFINKEKKLQEWIDKTDNMHYKHLIKYYKEPICFHYMEGRCKYGNKCKKKHPTKCNMYNHNNAYNCEYKDECNFAHIQFAYQPNGKVIKKMDEKMNNTEKTDNNVKKDNNNENEKEKIHKQNNNNDNNLMSQDIDRTIDELQQEMNNATSMIHPNFCNLGNVDKDRTYCDAAKTSINIDEMDDGRDELKENNEMCKDNNETTQNNDNNKEIEYYDDDNDNENNDNNNEMMKYIHILQRECNNTDSSQNITFEFTTEVIKRKIAKRSNVKNSVEYDNLEGEKKIIATKKFLTVQTEILVQILWQRCYGKIENLKNINELVKDVKELF